MKVRGWCRGECGEHVYFCGAMRERLSPRRVGGGGDCGKGGAKEAESREFDGVLNS